MQEAITASPSRFEARRYSFRNKMLQPPDVEDTLARRLRQPRYILNFDSSRHL